MAKEADRITDSANGQCQDVEAIDEKISVYGQEPRRFVITRLLYATIRVSNCFERGEAK